MREMTDKKQNLALELGCLLGVGLGMLVLQIFDTPIAAIGYFVLMLTFMIKQRI